MGSRSWMADLRHDARSLRLNGKFEGKYLMIREYDLRIQNEVETRRKLENIRTTTMSIVHLATDTSGNKRIVKCIPNISDSAKELNTLAAMNAVRVVSFINSTIMLAIDRKCINATSYISMDGLTLRRTSIA